MINLSSIFSYWTVFAEMEKLSEIYILKQRMIYLKTSAGAFEFSNERSKFSKQPAHVYF